MMQSKSTGCRLWLAGAVMLVALTACADRTPTATEAAAVPDVADGALIPKPARLEQGDGAFVLSVDTPLLSADAAAEAVAVRFADYLRATRGLELGTAVGGADEGAVHFALDPAFDGGSPEAYRLDVAPTGVRVVAAEPAGLFYGAVTLWQLATTQAEGDIRIPSMRIEDAPRFGWRGFMLDSARHFQSVEQIKKLLDAMALHKLNTFHWHLTDDQGWRIEIKRYPKLTEIGGCRIPAGDAGIDPASGKPRPYCGHYTQEQIRDIVAYAAERHITVVPEIDVPGHAQAAIASYPELGVTGERPPVSNEWGVHSWLFNVEEETFVFLENVLAEVVELFPGEYVHIGGDEAVKDQWESSARVQARMRELGAQDEMAMQGLLVERLEKFLAGNGKRLIGWDEILEAELPPAATVMSWRGIEGGIEAARKGHDVVMSPSSDLYLDYLQTTLPDEPPGRPATITVQDVYAFEPVPAELDAGQQKHILGLQANMWTEHTRFDERLEHNLFPRLAAVAESGWTPAADKNWDDFRRRLPMQLQRYRMLGIGHAQTPFQVAIEVDDDRAAGIATVALSNPLGYEIRHTTDGSMPVATSPAHAGPFEVALPAELRAAAFFDGEPLAEPQTFVLDPASLLVRTDEQLAICPDAGRLLLRLEDDGPADGERAIFNATIFYPCWQWNAADLDGIGAVKVRLGRIPYYFQLAHDEPSRHFEPAVTAHGELMVHGGGCEGELLAQLPMPAEPGADGFVELEAVLPPPPAAGRQDLCIRVTGDTRPAMWVVDRVGLVPGRP
ncbi:beta-N-acetylhexosaminidase [Marilutibacter alkalisoli]|uniref:beta-N-acetylhexosaminidase n=1 Tax=Marilutibacter alkalisoli TaxID=2591633 RepID=A0A514BX06_9GAMM|nr:family 20 glycosylhydrolase [Lysobacter alkalisoli]QDH71920.1 family 20 glycosylhydrolase [Lysobacter alkalisoli]